MSLNRSTRQCFKGSTRYKKTLLPIAETPKRLGFDDFAFKKRHNYSTILVDLDQRKPIDLLPDREAKTLEEWLKVRPDIELVIRDRSSVYAAAVTSSCPDAVQPGGRAVADRWHLLKNLSETVDRFLDGQRLAVRKSAQIIENSRLSRLLGQPKASWPDTDRSFLTHLPNRMTPFIRSVN